MALQRDTRYPGRFATSSDAHPMGAFKNRSAPDANDGTYLEADWANDQSGFLERILTVAGQTPNGNVDDATSSQVFDAMMSLMGGRLINIQVLTYSQTYNRTSGANKGRVMIVGGGGGGGGCPSTSSTQQATAGGGQSGAFADIWCTLPTSATVTIGNGGDAGTSAPTGGANGGGSSFGSLVTCPGGGGGNSGTAAVASSAVISNMSNGDNPTFSNSVTVLASAPCRAGEMQAIAIGINAAQVRGGDGGSSPLGLGGRAGRGGPGKVGAGYGVGGGGCSQILSNAGDVGGKGLGGVCIVWEYA